jgi:hypothetical protein
MWLRTKAGAATYSASFIEHWLQRLLYYEAPSWVFVLGYSIFGALVLATWWYFPPNFTRSVLLARRRRTAAYVAPATPMITAKPGRKDAAG